MPDITVTRFQGRPALSPVSIRKRFFSIRMRKEFCFRPHLTASWPWHRVRMPEERLWGFCPGNKLLLIGQEMFHLGPNRTRSFMNFTSRDLRAIPIPACIHPEPEPTPA